MILNGIPILIYSVIAFIFTFPMISSLPVEEVIVVHFFLVILFSFGSLATWGRLIVITSFLQEARQLNTICVSVAIISIAIATVPFILWTYGAIFNYNHALIISIILFVGILYGGFRMATRITNKLEGIEEVL